MPQGTPIKDFHGRIIGYIDEKGNGDKWVYSWGGRLLGKYLKSENVTRDWYGHNIAKGDVASSLLYSPDANR